MSWIVLFLWNLWNSTECSKQRRKESSRWKSIRISFLFKDQVAANAVRRQMRDLNNKIGHALQPVFVSKKLEQGHKHEEIKPPIVNQHCVVYLRCLWGDTSWHLHQRIAEHKNLAVGKHFREPHGDKSLLKQSQFPVLRKWQTKFYGLGYEMLLSKNSSPMHKLTPSCETLCLSFYTCYSNFLMTYCKFYLVFI